MHILVIDTSKREALCALVSEDSLKGEKRWVNDQQTGIKLLQAIEELLSAEKLGIRDISRIAVHAGPGGYSSLRAGIITAEHIALTTNAELVAISGDTLAGLIEAAKTGKSTPHIEAKYSTPVEKSY